MEHIALEVFDREGTGSKFTTLPENTSITIRRTSQLFGSGALWTYDFRLNVAANAHIFGTAGEIHGSRLHEQIDKRKARLWGEGVPMYMGYLRLGDEVEVDSEGNVNVIFESGQKTFEDLTEGAKANQVPLMDDVLIGLALWRKRKVTVTCRLQASVVFDYQKTDDNLWSSKPSEVFYQTPTHAGSIGRDVPFTADGEAELQSVQEYPRMVFPRLEEGSFDDLTGDGLTELDCINTDSPYDDTHPYCNVALCYQKQGYERTQKDGSVQTDYSAEPEAQRGYEYMPANRLNSAPCFYVIYWLRCLMNHLGIRIEENQMMDVEDLRRLFFVNTNCAYKEPETLRTAATIDSRYGKYQFHMGGRYGRQIQRLVPEYFGKREKAGEVAGQEVYRYDRQENINKEESGFVCTDYRLGQALPSGMPAVKHIKIDIDSIGQWSETDREQYERDNGYLHRAYATPECFPDAEISETIKALENGFGVRLLFSADYRSVRIVLLRNIFRSTAVQELNCEIVEPEEKVENSIRGFRMTYGDIDDTHFHYKGFDDLLPHKQELWQDNSDTHDYSKWKLDALYADIIKRVNAFDKTCYVTPATGNAYGIKIDKDAKRYQELHPSLFGYGEYMDAEDGDCTGEEETIETIEMGFMPAIMNDLNMDQERLGETDQRFALFVEETMRPRRPALKGEGTDYNDPTTAYPIYGNGGLYDESKDAVARSMKADDDIVKPGEFAVRSDMYAQTDGYRLSADLKVMLVSMIESATLPVTMNIDGHVNEGYRLYLQDNYEPSDTGTSPVETHDWGLTLGIMRGSGDDAYVRYEGDPDDGEDNDTWDVVPGSSVTAHPDTCDNYGREWDYDGMSQYSAADAEREIRTLCPATADNILSRRSASKQAARAAGWSAEIDTVGYIYHRVDYRSANDGVIPIYCTAIKNNGAVFTRTELESYVTGLCDHYGWRWFLDKSKSGVDSFKVILAVMPNDWTRIAALRAAYFGEDTMDGLDNGLGALDGRISLKLRAEKPNPYFDPKQPESESNRRYLQISNKSLRQRGLCDQFYKEYSKFIREARIWKGTVRMELAQLLTLDDTVRVTVGDVTGFIKEMEYSIDMQTGLGNVTLQIMYL